LAGAVGWPVTGAQRPLHQTCIEDSEVETRRQSPN
jgi:hypothetical protein